MTPESRLARRARLVGVPDNGVTRRRGVRSRGRGSTPPATPPTCW
ncbi:hypothetical protein E2C01_102009 [Portunus trituberculatus]|uniref:Uncharacterized protein n=1 Tax=Portunus trituberculatus TaxID=210409 RepID=A0A5B7KC20_PORTR|nr:hypothetical protein [Portunus trituberculatus]